MRVEKSDKDKDAARESSGSKRHWIACLFTSEGYGKPTKTHPGMDKPDVILKNTRKSLVDLKEQLLKLEKGAEGRDGGIDSQSKKVMSKDGPRELWSCKFNSGLFAVEWEHTGKVLEEELKSLGKTVRVVSPAKS